MSLFHAKDTQFACIVGNVVVSGACTNVYNGTMTASTTFDSDGSGLLTFDPFISSPVIFGQVIDGADTTTSVGGYLTFTGYGVSNVYLRMGPCPTSGATVSIAIMGLQKL